MPSCCQLEVSGWALWKSALVNSTRTAITCSSHVTSSYPKRAGKRQQCSEGIIRYSMKTHSHLQPCFLPAVHVQDLKVKWNPCYDSYANASQYCSAPDPFISALFLTSFRLVEIWIPTLQSSLAMSCSTLKLHLLQYNTGRSWLASRNNSPSIYIRPAVKLLPSSPPGSQVAVEKAMLGQCHFYGCWLAAGCQTAGCQAVWASTAVPGDGAALVNLVGLWHTLAWVTHSEMLLDNSFFIEMSGRKDFIPHTQFL